MSDKAKHLATLAALLMSECHEGASATTKARVGAKVYHPETVAADALALIRIGRGVSRWAVRACNGEGHQIYSEVWGSDGSHRPGRWEWRWNETDDAAKDKADARALAKLQAIADRYGATVKLGSDPRGYVVKLILASGRHNTWGGASDGWGVA